MSEWLYQFWFFSFKTAKCWGRGPKEWDAAILQLEHFPTISTMPQLSASSSASRSEPEAAIYQHALETIVKPSPLCRWSIHYYGAEYEPIQSRSPSPDPSPDPLDEGSWRQWPTSDRQSTYQERLINGLESNRFSNIDDKTLPIAIPQVVKALRKSKDELLEECLGFAIIARNSVLLDKITSQLEESSDPRVEDKVHELNPLHLAATYLDGSKSCCLLMRTLLFGSFLDEFRKPIYRPSDLNNVGHTVFDNLMITVLKAHTSIPPGAVDDNFRNEKRFPGEDLDVCGRWDADSDCVRQLLATGSPCIPIFWKHKFCHTSIQAITHCIEVLYDYSAGICETVPLSEVPSGLFLKRCFSCGLKMHLLPLHSIVLTALGLARFGKKDEDLFGIVAVLLYVLSKGADPRQTVELSISALLSTDEAPVLDEPVCDHTQLTPGQLASQISPAITQDWSYTTRTGWGIFCYILERSENIWRTQDMPARGKCDRSHPYRQRLCFGVDPVLSLLYAAVRTEVLTYRRLKEGDPWISPHFNMHNLLEGLKDSDQVRIDLVQREMMNPVCTCGIHMKPVVYAHTEAENITRFHFSNLEDWSRTTFIP